jgi:DNA repair exonuclease SbcCD ATPase subunit
MPNRVEFGSFNPEGETLKHPAIEYKLKTGIGAKNLACGVIEFQFAAGAPAPNYHGRRVYQIRLFDTFKDQHIPLNELEKLHAPEIAAHIAHYVKNIGPESFQNLSIEEGHSLAENPSLAERTVRRDHTEGKDITTIAQRIFAALNPHPGSFDEGSSFSGSTTEEEDLSFDDGSEWSSYSRSVSSEPFSAPVSPIRGDPRPRTKVPIPTPHPGGRPNPGGIADSSRVNQLERTVEALWGQLEHLNTSHTDLEDRVTGLGDRFAELDHRVASLKHQYRLQDQFIESFREEMLTEMDDLTREMRRANRRQDRQLGDLTTKFSEMEGRVAENAEQLKSLRLNLTDRLEKTETDIHSLKQKREESNIVEFQALNLALNPFRGKVEYAEDLRAITSAIDSENLADAKLGYQALLNKHIRAKEDEARSIRGKLAENSRALGQHNDALVYLEGNLGRLREGFVRSFREFSNAYARDFEGLRGGLDTEIRAREALEEKLETQQNFLRGFDEKLGALQTEQARLAAGLELQDRLRNINYSHLGDQLRAVNDKISQVQASKRDFETRTNGIVEAITTELSRVSGRLRVHDHQITYLHQQSVQMAARIDEFSAINLRADILEEEKAALLSTLNTVLADHQSHTQRLDNQQLILRQLLVKNSSSRSEEVEPLRQILQRHIRSSEAFTKKTAEKISQLERDRDELIRTVGSLKGRTRRLEQEMEELRADQLRQSDAYRILEETLRAEIADIESDPRDPRLAEEFAPLAEGLGIERRGQSDADFIAAILAHFHAKLEKVESDKVLALMDQETTLDSIEGMRAILIRHNQILEQHTREIEALKARRGHRGRSRAISPVGGRTRGVVIPTDPFLGGSTRDEYKARFMEILLDEGSSGHASGPNLVEVVNSIVKESTSKKKAIQAISILSKSISTAERELGQALIGDRNPDDVLKHIKKATILATVLTLFKHEIANQMGTPRDGDFYHYANSDTQSLLLRALPILQQISEQLRDFQTRLNDLPQFQGQPPFIDEVVDELIHGNFDWNGVFAVPTVTKRNSNTWKFH